jgi:hypothetical protein
MMTLQDAQHFRVVLKHVINYFIAEYIFLITLKKNL